MQKEGGKVGGWNDFVEHFMSVMVVMHTHTHVLFPVRMRLKPAWPNDRPDPAN
jgi:hypothetical protein